MTPYQIEILIHHHTSSARFERDNAPLYATIVRQFIESGILETLPDGSIRTTERGVCLVEMLCATPMPKMIWVDPRCINAAGNT